MKQSTQIFGVATGARSLAVTAQRRINTYYDFPQQGEKDRADVTIYGRPGLRPWAYFGAQPCRGWRVVWPYLYAVYGDTLYRIATDATQTAIGTLLTSAGPVYMADNGVQLMLADNPAGYILQLYGASAATGQVPANGLVQIAAVGFLGARHVSYSDNRFLVAVPGANPLASQQWQASNVGDGTGWSALANDLADSLPDPLHAVVGYQGRVCLMGPHSTEFWSNVGRTPFPFNRMPATSGAYGVAAINSIVEFGNAGLALLGAHRDGDVMPVLLTPQGFQPIGTPDLVHELASYDTVDDAIGATYEQDAHRFYQLTFPTARRCHVWDRQTRLWSEWSSYSAAEPLGPFRGGLAVKFGPDTLLASWQDGTIWRLDPEAYDDDGEILLRRLVSRHLFEGDEAAIINALQFDLEEAPGHVYRVADWFIAGASSAGAYLGTVSDVGASIMLEISRDKGRTWSDPLEAGLGPRGAYKTRAIFRRLGLGRNLTLRLTLTDPVKLVLTGEAMELERAA